MRRSSILGCRDPILRGFILPLLEELNAEGRGREQFRVTILSHSRRTRTPFAVAICRRAQRVGRHCVWHSKLRASLSLDTIWTARIVKAAGKAKLKRHP